jgi:hypothetical protein
MPISSVEEGTRFLALVEAVKARDALDLFGGVAMPFGKFIGKEMRDIPLDYLDRTVSVMPPTWFTRRVQEYVDAAMVHPLVPIGTGSADVPATTVRHLEDEWKRIHEPANTKP